MREGITVEVSEADRGRLEAIVADRNSPQKHVWRARIALAAARISRSPLATTSVCSATGRVATSAAAETDTLPRSTAVTSG